MLPPERRMRSREAFRDVVRGGRRVGRPLLSVHLLAPGADLPEPGPASAGLVVSKAVGGAVVRNRTSRRLRHLLRDRLPTLPPGCRVVVRATPAGGVATSAALGADLDAALTVAVRRDAGTPRRSRQAAHR